MTAMRQPPPFETLAGAGAIHLTRYASGAVEEWGGDAALAALGEALAASAGDRRSTTLWIDLTDPDAALVERVAATLGLHPLIAEDVVHGNQRSKIEVTDGLVHLVVFALEYDEAATGPTGDRVLAREIDIVLGEGFLLSAHPSAWDPRSGDHFRTGPAEVMKAGPDHLLWAIVDGIVDGYFPFADRLEDLIDRLQDEVVGQPDRRTLEELFELKRGLIAVRRAVSPVREILNQLTNRELALIDPEEVLYFRDIYDHVIRLADELDTDRDLVAATVEIYLSTINNNLSAIMKRLTGVTVILAGIGAIAGIFGMSEAGSAFAGVEAGGFWLVTLGVVALAVGAAAVLRRMGWI
ncbi:MAG TPA: magnesium transporter CorA family protein [Candidatus Limnocylindrales bacterium]|nr:magnesium transporter CorA family protein [Candidatus Limnocylindrales bacterium]